MKISEIKERLLNEKQEIEGKVTISEMHSTVITEKVIYEERCLIFVGNF